MRYRSFLREHCTVVIWLLWSSDMLVLWTCGRASFALVFGSQALFDRYIVAMAIGLALATAFFSRLSLYGAWRGMSRLEEMRQVAVGLLMTFMALVIVAFLTKTSSDFSRMWATAWLCSGLFGVALVRALLRGAFSHLRRRGFNQRQVLIIGGGVTGINTLQHLLALRDSGFQVVGYYSDDEPAAAVPATLATGGIDAALAYLEGHRVDQIWLAMYLSEEDTIRRLLSELKDNTADIRLVPGVFGVRLLNHSISEIGGLPVVNLSVSPMDGMNRLVKALQDRLLALLVLILTSPLLLFIALGVKLSSPGPVLYRQERMSWNGKCFVMLKFRTMPAHAERDCGPVWARRDQDRATPLGRWLRCTSLDELPQFWNVLMGEMSIVGPRPERPVFVQEFRHQIPGYMQKHKVKAGITGWAQVNGWRGDTDLKQRISHDLYYIDNWSLWFDIKIMLLTIAKGFVHRNAY